MHIERGPRKLEKITPGFKSTTIITHSHHPQLLLATPEHKLVSFQLKAQLTPTVKSKLFPLKELNIGSTPSLLAYGNDKTIVHCQDNQLLINNKQSVSHPGRINILNTDDKIALSCSMDFVYITSLEKAEKVGQLHEYGSPITSLYWKNSLSITGDQRGNIHLWDINQQKLIHSKSVFTTPVDSINSYVDFIHTNLFISLSKQQRKIAFHDLRTYKPLKTTNRLPIDLISVHQNPSGKIFLLSSQQVSLIDIYQNFEIVGKFSQMRGEKIEGNKSRYPEAGNQSRELTSLLAWNQYAIAGCDNGGIEVYNSDTLECIYGYGLSQHGKIMELARIDNSLIALDEKGLISMAHFG